MPAAKTLFVALLITWLTEWAVAAVILRHSDWSLAWNVLLVNGFTHPLANLAYHEWDVGFWIVEIVVCSVEVPLYRGLLRISWKRACAISFAGNGITAALSVIL